MAIHTTANIDVLLNGGTSTRATSLDIHLIEPQTGRVLPAWDVCNIGRDDALKIFKQQLGLALVNAQNAIKNSGSTVSEAITAMQEATGTVDKMLGQNPDKSTPTSTDGLMKAIGGQTPTTDKSVIEERMAAIYGINIVNGVMFPKGKTDLSGLRRLFKAMELSADTCDLSELDRLLAQDFIFVTMLSETLEKVTGNVCGEDIVEFTVVESKIGVNISIAQAMKISGKPAKDILIRFFWIGKSRNDKATLTRLKALGIEGDDLTAIVMAPKSTSRVVSKIVDTSVLSNLRSTLSDEEVCSMMSRGNTSGVNISPSQDEIMKAVRDLKNTHTSNINKAGTDTTDIETDATSDDASGAVSPSGRTGDPTMMMFSVLNFARTMRIAKNADGTVAVDGATVDPEALDDRCKDILAAVTASIDSLIQMAQQGADFIAALYGNLGFGTHTLQAGVGFATCLISINLGLDLSINLSLALPFQMAVFAAAFAAALAAVTAAVVAIKALVCVPQGLIDLLFGGICGFKPFDFGLCPPDLMTLIERLRGLISLVIGLIVSLLSALQVLRVDIQATARAAAELKLFSACALGATPLGIALNLQGSLLAGDLEATTSVVAT